MHDVWRATLAWHIGRFGQFLTKTYLFSYMNTVKLEVLKFIYSEKATKFCKISTLLLSVGTVDKSKVEISQKNVQIC